MLDMFAEAIITTSQEILTGAGGVGPPPLPLALPLPLPLPLLELPPPPCSRGKDKERFMMRCLKVMTGRRSKEQQLCV
jgi:hypothetical protein